MLKAIYRNFTIRAWSEAKGELKVEVYGVAPGGTQAKPETVRYSRGLFEIDANGSKVDLLDAIKTRRAKQDTLCLVGTILADLIMPPQVRALYVESRRTASNRGERLRLRLMLQLPDLKSLPWEFLYIAQAPGVCDPSGFLALDQDISIVRHEDLNGAEPPSPRGGNYRMVAALASPEGDPKLDIESDYAAIVTALKGAPAGVTITPTWVKPATRADLMAALSTPCDIFHFSGHGYYDEAKATGSLLLEDPADRRSESYEAYKLGLLLKDAKAKVAILSACETAQRPADYETEQLKISNAYGGVAATLVLNGMAAVVASQYTLRDKNALSIPGLLYTSLVSGEPIDDGVYKARKAILQGSDLTDRDWGALVLYHRIEDGIVFPPGSAAQQTVFGPRVDADTQQTDLIGRQTQLEQLGKQLNPGFKLAFHGVYGVGKTSLATALFTHAVTGETFGKGHIWRTIGKASAASALELLATDFPGQQVSSTATLPKKVEAFKALLKSFPGMLFGLDEVSDIKVAEVILDATAGSAVVMNGTARLKLPTATDIAVEPLSPSDARCLFLSLIKLPSPNAADLALIDDICEQMGRLPLGVRLAALKCAEGETLEMLQDRLDTAPGTIPDDKARELFKAAFDELASSATAQTLLIRIACFPTNQASLDALRAGEDNVKFFQAKDKLIALGLLDPSGPGRVSQHPLLNVRSDDSIDRGLIDTQRDFVEQWIEGYAAKHRVDYAMLRKEHGNLLGLVEDLIAQKQWNRVIGSMRNLFDYLRVRGLWQECFDKIDLCLQNEIYLNDANRGWALLHRAILHTLMGRFPKALYDLERAGQRFTHDGDQVNLGRVHYRIAAVGLQTGELQIAGRELHAAIAAMAPNAGEAGADLAGAYARLGAILDQQGDRRKAQEAFQDALKQAAISGDAEEEARAYLGMGAMNQATDAVRAIADFEKALAIAERTGNELQGAGIKLMIGYQHYYAGKYPDAQTQFDAALESYRRFGYQPGIAKGELALGNSALAQRDHEGAEQHYREAIRINAALGQHGAAAYATYQLAVVAHRTGRPDDAERGYVASQTYAKKEKDRILEAAVLAQLARLKLDQQDTQAAKTYALMAEKAATELEDRLTQAAALQTLSLVHKALGEDAQAQEKRVAAAEARATMKDVGSGLAVAAEVERLISRELTPTDSSWLGHVAPVSKLPDLDRILGGQKDMTYTTREPKGDSDKSGGGFDGGGFSGGNGIIP